MRKTIRWGAFGLSLLMLVYLLSVPAFAAEAGIVARIATQEITADTLQAAYDISYGDYAQEDAELAFALKLEVLNMLLQEEAERQMMEKQGFTNHSPEEIAQATELAKQEYAANLAYYTDLLAFGDEGFSGSGASQDYRAQAEALLASSEMAEEDLIAQAVQNLGYEKLRDWAVSGDPLTEEDLLAYYDQMVEDDKALYQFYPDDFISCMAYGIPCLYVPEGMREIGQILIAFDADQVEEYAFLSDAGLQGEDASADLDALYDSLSERVQLVYTQIGEGVPFETLSLQYSDAWMLSQLADEGRVCVSADTTFWDPAFRDAAMALSQVGEISQPLRMADGIYILAYLSDLPAGPVPFAQVRDYVADAAAYMAASDAYDAAVAQWMEELGAEIFLDAIQ